MMTDVRRDKCAVADFVHATNYRWVVMATEWAWPAVFSCRWAVQPRSSPARLKYLQSFTSTHLCGYILHMLTKALRTQNVRFKSTSQTVCLTSALLGSCWLFSFSQNCGFHFNCFTLILWILNSSSVITTMTMMMLMMIRMSYLSPNLNLKNKTMNVYETLL